ncbi:MAG: hypothetical protein ACRDIB_08145, partial [Ardenticatenaceae bacterium]
METIADSEQIIQLAGHEEIHALRQMLAQTEAPRLLFVVPERHPAFDGLLPLKLLVRQAHASGVQLALVTRDGNVRALGKRLKLSVFRSVGAARAARRWR